MSRVIGGFNGFFIHQRDKPRIKYKAKCTDFSGWLRIELARFLNTISTNGHPPKETPEQIIGLETKAWRDGLVNSTRYQESLSTCLALRRGRRFMITEKGQIGLVPFIGSAAGKEGKRGSRIAVLYAAVCPLFWKISRGKMKIYLKWSVIVILRVPCTVRQLRGVIMKAIDLS